MFFHTPFLVGGNMRLYKLKEKLRDFFFDERVIFTAMWIATGLSAIALLLAVLALVK